MAIERAVFRLPDSAYHTVYVNNLPEQSRDEYVSSGVTFLIASSEGFGPAFAQPDEHPEAHRAYSELLDEAGQCLRTVEPTSTVSGPHIRVCQLRTE